MIKTIIFDLGGVYFTDGTKQAIQSISSKYGISPEKIEDILKGDLGTKYRIGAVTAQEFWDQANEYWGIEASNDELATTWFLGYEPIQGTVDIIAQLRASNYELLFLSDNVQERIDYLENKYQFLHYFKDGIFSHIVKTRKPDPAIYKLVLEKASNPPEECLYIDDKEELLLPAQELGMRTVWFKNSEQLLEDLKNFGIDLDN
ncbi:MAG TPA: HAD family phosphatase [Candidatus Andersenbacteria bacterium]|nr:HAD family phosphatase [Candidatus Andersenbacteria bacterium]